MICNLNKFSLGFLKGKLIYKNEMNFLALRSWFSFRFYSQSCWTLGSTWDGAGSPSSSNLFDKAIVMVFGKLMHMWVEHGEIFFFSFTSELLYSCFQFGWKGFKQIFKNIVLCFATISKRHRHLFKGHYSSNLSVSTNVFFSLLLFLDYQLPFVPLNVVVKTVSQYTCMQIATNLMTVFYFFQPTNGIFLSMFLIVLPLESLAHGLFHELGNCLGGTSVGYAIVIPTNFCRYCGLLDLIVTTWLFS